jgi:hypothetical protein
VKGPGGIKGDDGASDGWEMPDTPDQTGADILKRGEARLDTAGGGGGGLSCRAGRVLDLSGSGMRLCMAWKHAPRVGDVGTYTFGEGADEVGLMGTVRWVRPAGRLRKRAEVGIEFVGLTPAKRDALRRLAISGDAGPLADAARERVKVGFPDLYRMFGVSVYASQEDLRRAYHALAKELHPDRSTDPEADTKFAELNKAYSILRDRDLRARYDERLAAEQQRAA